jgi:hypothetical protein
MGEKMMSNSFMLVIRWTLPGSLIIGVILRTWYNPSYETLYELAVGFALAFLLLVLYSKRHGPERVLWNEESMMLSVIRPWVIEVAGALLLTTIPIGIDLKQNAERVLQSLNTRFSDTRIPAELRFFIARPLINSPTIAGFMVTRKLPRLPRILSILQRTVQQDLEILEGIMRAVYHHVPVMKADCDNLMLINSGGTITLG